MTHASHLPTLREDFLLPSISCHNSHPCKNLRPLLPQTYIHPKAQISVRLSPQYSLGAMGPLPTAKSLALPDSVVDNPQRVMLGKHSSARGLEGQAPELTE